MLLQYRYGFSQVGGISIDGLGICLGFGIKVLEIFVLVWALGFKSTVYASLSEPCSAQTQTQTHWPFLAPWHFTPLPPWPFNLLAHQNYRFCPWDGNEFRPLEAYCPVCGASRGSSRFTGYNNQVSASSAPLSSASPVSPASPASPTMTHSFSNFPT